MSLLKSKKKKPLKGKQAKKAVKKQSMSFEDFQKSFRSLDMNNYGSWPFVVKLTVLLLIIILIGALTFFVPVQKKLEQITAGESEQQALLETYREKESKARHLKEYKNQIAQMEVEFNSLLNQLPKDTRVSELVKGINMTGVGSNIRFRDITVEAEEAKEFFIEQPIVIQAVGSYHQFGSFISGLASLPRIVTMHDFTLENTKPFIESPELNMTLQTKTYRSKDLSENKEEDKDGKKDKSKDGKKDKDEKKDDKKKEK